MRIAVGSKDHIELKAVNGAAKKLFKHGYKLKGYPVDSGVSHQPLGLDVTNEGAIERARAALTRAENADVGVGIETGLMILSGRYVYKGIVHVLGRDGSSGLGSSLGIAIPKHIVELVRDGQELSQAVAEHYGTAADRDCLSVITKGRLATTEFLRQPTTFAFIDYQSQAGEVK